MKKFILTITVMLTLSLSSVYADKKDEINKEVVESFRKDFAGAENIVWQMQKQYAKASFTLNGQVMFARYTEDGKLQAAWRNVLSDHLPVLLLAKLKRNYSGYWISDLMEITTEDETAWYVKLESADETFILKSNIYNQWSVYKKIKKD